MKLVEKEEFMRKRSEMVFHFGEEAVDIAEIAASKYVGPVDVAIDNKDFKAICYAASLGMKAPTGDKREEKIKELLK